MMNLADEYAQMFIFHRGQGNTRAARDYQELIDSIYCDLKLLSERSDLDLRDRIRDYTDNLQWLIDTLSEKLGGQN